MRISDWSSDVCSSDLFSGGVPLRWAIAALIVASFLISAAAGLQKGIAGLSVLNTWLFFAIIAFVLVAGPLGDMIGLSLSGGADYVRTFVPRNLGQIGRAHV